MDLSSRTAQLCIAGTQAEFARRLAEARRLYQEAWDAASDDYDASMAAHYVAHVERDPQEALRWNLIALKRAQRDARATEFLPSLYVSLGGSYQSVGNLVEAERYFALAAALDLTHQRG